MVISEEKKEESSLIMVDLWNLYLIYANVLIKFWEFFFYFGV